MLLPLITCIALFIQPEISYLTLFKVNISLYKDTFSWTDITIVTDTDTCVRHSFWYSLKRTVYFNNSRVFWRHIKMAHISLMLFRFIKFSHLKLSTNLFRLSVGHSLTLVEITFCSSVGTQSDNCRNHFLLRCRTWSSVCGNQFCPNAGHILTIQTNLKIKQKICI
jgi:hypothetical protein